jgi:hypothetical membrane protein
MIDDEGGMGTLALGGVAGPLLFVSAVLAAAAGHPGYSHLVNFISELGATGAPRAALMNDGGFIPAGVLIAGFGVSVGSLLPRLPMFMAGAALVTLFGVGAAASGVFSCDLGCPIEGGTPANQIHNVIGPGCFVFLIVGTAILGWGFRGVPAWRRLSAYSLATSAIALVFFLSLLGSLDDRVWTGLWQRLMLGTLFLWCGVAAVHAFRLKARPTADRGVIGS